MRGTRGIVRQRRHGVLAYALAFVALGWIGILGVMHINLQGGHIGSDGGASGISSGLAKQTTGVAMELGSLQQAGALQLAIMELEGSMDAVGKKILAGERSRLNSAMRKEMEMESLKQKSNRTGEVKHLKTKRVLEPNEIEGFVRRRDTELKRLAQVVAKEHCSMIDDCAKSMASQIDAVISGDDSSSQLPFVVTSSLDYATEAEGRKIFGSSLPADASELWNWLPRDVSRMRYKSCAVVGNSGILRSRGHGASIDTHEAVLRVNQAPTAGHERDVGVKSTIRLLNSAWGRSYVNHVQSDKLLSGLKKNETLVATRISSQNFVSLARKIRDLQSKRDGTTLLLANTVIADARTALDLFRLISQRKLLLANISDDVSKASSKSGTSYKGGQTPSTGLLAVMLALRICGSVSVYGFSHEISRDSTSSSYSYHYFSNFPDSAELRAHPHHSFKLEGDLLASLQQRGLLRLCEATSQCKGNPSRMKKLQVKKALSGQEPAKEFHQKLRSNSADQASALVVHKAEGRLHEHKAEKKGADLDTRTMASKASETVPLIQHHGQRLSTADEQVNKPSGSNEKKKASKNGLRGMDRTTAKKMAFLKGSNGGRLDNDVPISEIPDEVAKIYNFKEESLSWDELSAEQQRDVEHDRLANDGLEQILEAALEDAAELRQLERHIKKKGGRRSDGKIITLRSGTRLALPQNSAALVRAGEGLEVIPKIQDPILSLAKHKDSEEPSSMRDSVEEGQGNQPPANSQDLEGQAQDMVSVAKVSGSNDGADVSDQDLAVQDEPPFSAAGSDPALILSYGSMGSSDKMAGQTESGMTAEVMPTIAGISDEAESVTKEFLGTASLDDKEEEEEGASGVDSNASGEEQLRPLAGDGPQETSSDQVPENKPQDDISSKTPPARHQKHGTQAQQFKHDQRAAARLAKMKLEDIADPAMRAREEAWRKMEEEIPAKEVDINCLSRGSSDGCFKNWLNSSSRGSRATTAQQHQQAGVPMVEALRRERKGAAAASVAAMQLRKKAHISYVSPH